MSCSYGEKFKITVFGQSHSQAIGVVIDGIPAGVQLDMQAVGRFMSRRAPGRNSYSTPRKEADEPEIISGVVDGVTCGAPLCAVIQNTNCRSQDYDDFKNLPRPSHSDFAAFVKHGGFNDIRGGGNFSGRLTAPLCFAGAVAAQLLEKKNIFVGAHIKSIAGVEDLSLDPVRVSREQLAEISRKDFAVIDDGAGEKMREKIEAARLDSDSVGGVIECAAVGVEAGLGEPMFGGLENEISRAVFAVPAVKGVEFGNGFDCALLRGSENNDAFKTENGRVVTETNNHGGILGGISSGMPLIFRVAVKPTASVGKPQQTVNLKTGETQTLVVGGRHDPCIVPRAVPCIEAAAAVALVNFIL